jgi:hypothetical protein
MDGKHVPRQVSLKFVSMWFGSFRVHVTRGPVVQLDLRVTLGNMSPWVNVRRLKFFEECDADLVGPDDGLVLPLISPVADDHDPHEEDVSTLVLVYKDHYQAFWGVLIDLVGELLVLIIWS